MQRFASLLFYADTVFLSHRHDVFQSPGEEIHLPLKDNFPLTPARIPRVTTTVAEELEL